MTAAETVRRAAARIGGADRILAEEEVGRFVEDPETLVVPRAGEVLFRLR